MMRQTIISDCIGLPVPYNTRPASLLVFLCACLRLLLQVEVLRKVMADWELKLQESLERSTEEAALRMRLEHEVLASSYDAVAKISKRYFLGRAWGVVDFALGFVFAGMSGCCPRLQSNRSLASLLSRLTKHRVKGFSGSRYFWLEPLRLFSVCLLYIA